MTVEELFEKISATEYEDIKLYFITRLLKNGESRKSKNMDKFLYKVYQVDIDDGIRENLFSYTKDKLNDIIDKNYAIVDFDVISDDTESILTYYMKERNYMSFYDVVYNKLHNSIQLTSIEEIIISNNEELWAYCVGFNDTKTSEWIYTFRKIQPNKVAIDERDNKKNIIQKIIRVYFNTTSNKFELLNGTTITFDNQIDCIFYNDNFYIIKKGNFEQIVGLQEEYKIEAEEVVSILEKTDMITGLDIIKNEIETNPSIHKKLVRISRLDNYKNISKNDIKKMESVSERYGLNLKIENNKLVINEQKDIDSVLKMLADYYKIGEISGKPYGTFSGKEIKTTN